MEFTFCYSPTGWYCVILKTQAKIERTQRVQSLSESQRRARARICKRIKVSYLCTMSLMCLQDLFFCAHLYDTIFTISTFTFLPRLAVFSKHLTRQRQSQMAVQGVFGRITWQVCDKRNHFISNKISL